MTGTATSENVCRAELRPEAFHGLAEDRLYQFRRTGWTDRYSCIASWSTREWVDQARFLHALNFCMLLPGPEAQKLATYLGWLLHGVRGGLSAGILFILPGAFVMLGLSLLYALGRGISIVDGALFGIKAAVLVIVIEALIRIGKRALKTPLLLSLAAAAFVGIFFLALPFPLIVAAAALVGYVVSRRAGSAWSGRKNRETSHHPQKIAGGSSPSRRSSASLRGGCRSRLPQSSSGQNTSW